MGEVILQTPRKESILNDKTLPKILTTWVKKHHELLDPSFKIWYSLRYGIPLSDTPKLSQSKMAERYVKDRLEEVKEEFPDITYFLNTSTNLNDDDVLTGYSLLLYNKEVGSTFLNELMRYQDQLTPGTLRTIADMFLWSKDHWNRVNSRAYYRLLGKRKPKMMNERDLARYVVNRYFDLYTKLQNRITSSENIQDVIYETYTRSLKRPRVFDYSEPGEKVVEEVVPKIKKLMFNLPFSKSGEHPILNPGYSQVLRFYMLHPEQIDPTEFYRWNRKRGIRKRLTQYLFNEKSKVIQEFVRDKWEEIEKKYPDVLDLIRQLPEPDRRYAYLGMGVDPEGTAGIIRELSRRTDLQTIREGTFKTIWDMYAWAHDHWYRVNRRHYKRIIGKPKPRRVDPYNLGRYVVGRYLDLKSRFKTDDEVYHGFTGTSVRTVIFQDYDYPQPVNKKFDHTHQPSQTGRLIHNPYPTVYYTPVIPRFSYTDKDTIRKIKMQGSAIVKHPPYPNRRIVGYDPDTTRFRWFRELRSATGHPVRPKDTVAVDPRFLGYYLYVDSSDPEIRGFYRCVDTGQAITSTLRKRLYITGRERFDIDFYAGAGEGRNVWSGLQARFNRAKRRGDLKIYLFPPNYFR